VLIASAAQRFNERGELTDETSRELIRKLLAELMAWTKRLKG
jgi:chromate reductase